MDFNTLIADLRAKPTIEAGLQHLLSELRSELNNISLTVSDEDGAEQAEEQLDTLTDALDTQANDLVSAIMDTKDGQDGQDGQDRAPPGTDQAINAGDVGLMPTQPPGGRPGAEPGAIQGVDAADMPDPEQVKHDLAVNAARAVGDKGTR